MREKAREGTVAEHIRRVWECAELILFWYMQIYFIHIYLYRAHDCLILFNKYWKRTKLRGATSTATTKRKGTRKWVLNLDASTEQCAYCRFQWLEGAMPLSAVWGKFYAKFCKCALVLFVLYIPVDIYNVFPRSIYVCSFYVYCHLQEHILPVSPSLSLSFSFSMHSLHST